MRTIQIGELSFELRHPQFKVAVVTVVVRFRFLPLALFQKRWHFFSVSNTLAFHSEL